MQLLAHLGPCLSKTCRTNGILYKCGLLSSRKLEQLAVKTSACIMLPSVPLTNESHRTDSNVSVGRYYTTHIHTWRDDSLEVIVYSRSSKNVVAL